MSRPASWVPVIPSPGVYEHAVYGPIELTPERIKRFIDNVNFEQTEGIDENWTQKYRRGIYQSALPVSFDYGVRLENMVGWLTAMRPSPSGGAEGQIEWIPKQVSKKLLRIKNIGIAPEWYDSWTDPLTGVVHHDVLIGVSLTTAPFFQELMVPSKAILETVLEETE